MCPFARLGFRRRLWLLRLCPFPPALLSRFRPRVLLTSPWAPPAFRRRLWLPGSCPFPGGLFLPTLRLTRVVFRWPRFQSPRHPGPDEDWPILLLECVHCLAEHPA